MTWRWLLCMELLKLHSIFQVSHWVHQYSIWQIRNRKIFNFYDQRLESLCLLEIFLLLQSELNQLYDDTLCLAILWCFHLSLLFLISASLGIELAPQMEYLLLYMWKTSLERQHRVRQSFPSWILLCLFYSIWCFLRIL